MGSQGLCKSPLRQQIDDDDENIVEKKQQQPVFKTRIALAADGGKLPIILDNWITQLEQHICTHNLTKGTCKVLQGV